jgi:hypothetical protein
MAENSSGFSIDDSLGAPENLQNFAKNLESEHAELGKTLSNYLTTLASGQTFDTATIWNALDAAIAPVMERDASSDAE